MLDVVGRNQEEEIGLRIYTYGYEAEISNPFLYVSNNLITSSGQKCSRASTNSVKERSWRLLH